MSSPGSRAAAEMPSRAPEEHAPLLSTRVNTVCHQRDLMVELNHPKSGFWRQFKEPHPTPYTRSRPGGMVNHLNQSDPLMETSISRSIGCGGRPKPWHASLQDQHAPRMRHLPIQSGASGGASQVADGDQISLRDQRSPRPCAASVALCCTSAAGELIDPRASSALLRACTSAALPASRTNHLQPGAALIRNQAMPSRPRRFPPRPPSGFAGTRSHGRMDTSKAIVNGQG